MSPMEIHENKGKWNPFAWLSAAHIVRKKWGEPMASSFDADSVSLIMTVYSGVLQLQTVFVGNEL